MTALVWRGESPTWGSSVTSFWAAASRCLCNQREDAPNLAGLPCTRRDEEYAGDDKKASYALEADRTLACQSRRCTTRARNTTRPEDGWSFRQHESALRNLNDSRKPGDEAIRNMLVDNLLRLGKWADVLSFERRWG